MTHKKALFVSAALCCLFSLSAFAAGGHHHGKHRKDHDDKTAEDVKQSENFDPASIEPAAGDEIPSASSEALATASAPDAAPLAPAGASCTGDIAAEGRLLTFYQAAGGTVTREENALRIAGKGVTSVDGVQYRLQYIEFPKTPALPVNSVQYPLEARFIHQAADGKSLAVSVPLKEGKANAGFEALLQNNGQASFDPDDLMPSDRHYGAFRGGEGCGARQELILTTPVDVSAAQIERFGKLF